MNKQEVISYLDNEGVLYCPTLNVYLIGNNKTISNIGISWKKTVKRYSIWQIWTKITSNDSFYQLMDTDNNYDSLIKHPDQTIYKKTYVDYIDWNLVDADFCVNMLNDRFYHRFKYGKHHTVSMPCFNEPARLRTLEKNFNSECEKIESFGYIAVSGKIIEWLSKDVLRYTKVYIRNDNDSDIKIDQYRGNCGAKIN